MPSLPDTFGVGASVCKPRPGDHQGLLPYDDDGAAAPAARSHSRGGGGCGCGVGTLVVALGRSGAARPANTKMCQGERFAVSIKPQ
jgi:hypothetical protein